MQITPYLRILSLLASGVVPTMHFKLTIYRKAVQPYFLEFSKKDLVKDR